ncbi:hypothetical protein MTBUT4_70141 [Magnetospirillum sp. UT-4]|nr:hypothetical protein MTBUT4_70141 [Magnetospirillum sp. UT-4]
MDGKGGNARGRGGRVQEPKAARAEARCRVPCLFGKKCWNNWWAFNTIFELPVSLSCLVHR